MNHDEIETLAKEGIFEGRPLRGRVEETHISWVILSQRHAFKIKKPVSLSFLDFSTLARRKQYCLRELMLNRRFSDIYLDVLPVSRQKGKWYIGENQGQVHDYTVRMKRMSSAKRMDNLLRTGKVSTGDVHHLARVIAGIHKNCPVLYLPFRLPKARKIFNDIVKVRSEARKKLGREYASFIDRAILWSDAFLSEHAKRIRKRIELGYLRDVHGDLHSRNIFLYRKPVLFDCIEFDDEYRQIDVLYEIAFLCMDMEAFGKQSLAKHFVNTYTKHFPCMDPPEDEHLFRYFKCLRANIRAKVCLLNAAAASDTKDASRLDAEAARYFTLMQRYIDS